MTQEEYNPETVAKNLCMLLKKEDITRAMLAEWADIGQRTVYRFTRPSGGWKGHPYSLARIAKVLRVTTEWLNEEHEDEWDDGGLT